VIRHIDAAALRDVLRIDGLVEALRAGHRRDPPLMERVLMQPDGEPNSYLVWHAWQPGELLVTKMVTSFPANAGRPATQAVVTVFDGRDGAPTAVIDGTELTYWKTAASSLLAASYLARPDSAALLMIGAGDLAPHLIRGYRAMMPSIETVWLWNRTAHRADSLAAALPGVTVIDDIDRFAGRADIICCATASDAPLVHGASLAEGVHVDLVGGFTPTMREADDDTVRRASVFVDSTAFNVDACGDLSQPVAAGTLQRSDLVDTFALCRGLHPGRRRADEITVFKSGGGAHLDLMAAQHVLAVLPSLPLSRFDGGV
jgi:alanine dehydrogenase